MNLEEIYIIIVLEIRFSIRKEEKYEKMRRNICSFVNTDDIDIIESANYFQDALLSEHEYIVWTDPFIGKHEK